MAQRLIDTIWGSTGTVIDPGDTKLNLGWTAEIPRYEWENYWHERVDEQAQYLQQTGVGEWIATVTYVANAIVMHEGVLYQSLQAGNVAHATSAPTWWEPFGGLSLLPRGYIDGLVISPNVVDADGTIDIAPGAARSAPNGSGVSVGMGLDSAFTKSIGGAWEEGSTGDGLASTLTLAINTWYRVFAIGKVTGEMDFGFDVEADAGDLLDDASGDGYEWARQIGWVMTDDSNDIIHFWVDPGDPSTVYLSYPPWDPSVYASWNTDAILMNPIAPPHTTVLLEIAVTQSDPDNNNQYTTSILLTPTATPDISIPAVSAPYFTFRIKNESGDGDTEGDNTYSVSVSMAVDANSQYRFRAGRSRIFQDAAAFRTRGFRYSRSI